MPSAVCNSNIHVLPQKVKSIIKRTSATALIVLATRDFTLTGPHSWFNFRVKLVNNTSPCKSCVWTRDNARMNSKIVMVLIKHTIFGLKKIISIINAKL